MSSGNRSRYSGNDRPAGNQPPHSGSDSFRTRNTNNARHSLSGDLNDTTQKKSTYFIMLLLFSAYCSQFLCVSCFLNFTYFYLVGLSASTEHFSGSEESQRSVTIPMEVVANLIRRLDSLSRNMEVLKASQRDQLSILNILMNNTAPPEPQLANLTEELGFPLKEIKDFRVFQRRMKDETMRLKLVGYYPISFHSFTF